MFSSKTILITALAAIGSANAISSGCGTTVAALAFGDLGGCLQLTSALSLLRGDSGNFTGTLNNYLNSLCASSTPRCSNATLTDAQTRITSGCSEDLQNGGTDGATVQGVQAILTNYDEAIAAACSRNSTTGDFCVSSTLETIQTVSGTSISFDFLTGLISGSSDSTALQTAFQSGQLCTGCVQEIYYQARQANASIATSSVGSAVSGACGADFGASAPSGVQAGTSPSQSSAQASTSPSGAASRVASLPLNAPLAVGGVAAMFGVVVGGLAIF